MIWCLAVACPALVVAQPSFAPQAGEYAVAGLLFSDQTLPQLSLNTSGGYIVWQDNITDGDGLGISARRLDSSFSGSLGSFRVNQIGTGDQEKPRVALLNGGGAVFVWRGGRLGFQHIYARFLSSSNTWLTGDVPVNALTNNFQINLDMTTLANGNVAIVWTSFGQQGSSSLQDVFGQLFSPTGQKIGGEFPVNQSTTFNQRTPAIAALSGGGFVVVWVSEQQRGGSVDNSDANHLYPPANSQPSVDIFGRLYGANGSPLANEFVLNANFNVCANPRVAAAGDGGFMVAWGQKDGQVRSNSWDIFARPFSSAGFGGTAQRVNTQLYGDQFGPQIRANGTDYLVVWTSLGQDGSMEGVYGQFLRGDGIPSGGEFRVNTSTHSKQMHSTVASDGNGRFLVAWTSFAGGNNSFDLSAQRYASAGQVVPPPAAPFVSALSSTKLSLAWPVLAGFNVANYEVYADGSASATAVVVNNMWTMSGLAPGSTHSFRLAYVLTDGRRSPLSGTSTGTAWGVDENFDGLPDDWEALYWGNNADNWPSPLADSDGDGVSDKNEFMAGTNPTDRNSVLRTQLNSTPQGMFLSWNTQPGLMYQVQTSTDLTAWVNLGAPRFAAGAVDSLYVGAGSKGYYRILRVR